MESPQRRKQQLPPPAPQERAVGCLVGLAVGDALGGPLEYMGAHQIRIRHGIVKDMIGGGWLLLRPGQTTDDTAMARALAESLLARAVFDREDVAARYVAWLRSEPMAVDQIVHAALSAIIEGAPVAEAARAGHEATGGQSAGNGALVRGIPLGIRFRDDPRALVAAAREDAAITHLDPIAPATSAALCLFLAEVLRGEEDLEAARTRAEDLLAEHAGDLPVVVPHPTSTPRSRLRTNSEALDTLEAGMWCAWQAQDFEEALVTAVNLGGDTDAIGAVAGAVAGARFGRRAIPARWTGVLQDRPVLERLGRSLFEAAGLPGGGGT